MVKKFKYTIAIMITLIIFVWIIEIVNGGLPYVDQWTRPFVIKLKGAKLYYFFRRMTELGSRSFLIPFTIAGSLLLWIITMILRSSEEHTTELHTRFILL